jgi:hypothetical protein
VRIFNFKVRANPAFFETCRLIEITGEIILLHAVGAGLAHGFDRQASRLLDTVIGMLIYWLINWLNN